MMDIVEDISKMQGVPLYPDDDDGVWYNVTPEGVTLYHTIAGAENGHTSL